MFVAVLAVGLVFWIRHQRLEAYRGEVAASADALLNDIGKDMPVDDEDAVQRLVRQTANFELGRLRAPVVSGPVRIGEDGTAEASILMTGASGGGVRLRWQGTPPVLVGVERLEGAPDFQPSEQEMQQP
ncbi:MAG: hypothetical protein CMJ34_09215 [Phycisphaerae bacterium]|nr:hypothetical protein [Phycisphaerae bacterium]